MITASTFKNLIQNLIITLLILSPITVLHWIAMFYFIAFIVIMFMGGLTMSSVIYKLHKESIVNHVLNNPDSFQKYIESLSFFEYLLNYLSVIVLIFVFFIQGYTILATIAVIEYHLIIFLIIEQRNKIKSILNEG